MARRGKWSERVKYVVSVLWLHGESTEAQIAVILTKANICGAVTRGQVSGMIGRSGYRGLNRDQRQKVLDDLKLLRTDKHIIPDRCFTAQERL